MASPAPILSSPPRSTTNPAGRLCTRTQFSVESSLWVDDPLPTQMPAPPPHVPRPPRIQIHHDLVLISAFEHAQAPAHLLVPIKLPRNSKPLLRQLRFR